MQKGLKRISSAPFFFNGTYREGRSIEEPCNALCCLSNSYPLRVSADNISEDRAHIHRDPTSGSLPQACTEESLCCRALPAIRT